MKVKPNFRIKNNQNSVYRPKQQTNAKYGDFWEKAERPLIIIGTALFTGGISYGFHCLRENKKTKEAKKRADYISEKKAKDRQAKRDEEKAAREQAEREAEERIQNQVNDEANAVEDPKPANEVVSSAPDDIKSTRLYADLIHKGNIAVVFGPKGEGKSIFTTQMLAGVVKGTPEDLFPEFGQQHDGQHGIIIDFEQSRAQLKGRYGKEGYRLPEDFDFVCGKAFTKLEAFKAYLRNLIGKLTRSTVIAIDNLSKALPILQDESARDLFRFLSECIESAKRDKGIDLTFVLVAHTNKEGYGVSIGTEHLKGTSKVADFADLVLAIGPTRFGKGIKMLKVLHNRNEPEPETVPVMKKVDSKPYLHFEPVSKMREEDALPNKAKNVKWEKPCEDNEQDDNEQQPEKFTHEEKVEMWKLNKEEHLSYEKIAAKFKKEGKTTSRQNVGIYVRAIEDEMESSRLTDSAPDQQ